MLIIFSLSNKIGIARSITLAIGLGIIVGYFEAMDLIENFSEHELFEFSNNYLYKGLVNMVNQNGSKSFIQFIIMLIGITITVCSFIGIIDFYSIIMFSVGFVLVISTLEFSRRKHNK